MDNAYNTYSFIKYFDNQMVAFARTGKHVVLRACRSCTFKPDPILYLPMSTTARSRLVRWRLGRFTAMQREKCPCMYLGTLLSRYLQDRSSLFLINTHLEVSADGCSAVFPS
jgi:hypothetical protein